MLAFVSLSGYGQVSFVSGSGVVSHAFASYAGLRYCFGLAEVCRARRKPRFRGSVGFEATLSN